MKKWQQPICNLPVACSNVSGEFFLEVFAGVAALTLGIMMHCVPCLKPWDCMYDEQFDVLTQGWIIIRLIRAGVIVVTHFGTPCKSFTWARIPQVRNWDHPLGLPGLTGNAQTLVNLGNQLLLFTWQCCVELLDKSGYFSIENPEKSWLWITPQLRALADDRRVAFARFLFKNFGLPYVKPTLVLHNMPSLHLLRVPMLPWPGETFPLRGKVRWHGQEVFRTQVAEPYPPALGARYGDLVAQSLALRTQALTKGQAVPFAVACEGVKLGRAWACEAEATVPSFADEAPLVPNGLGARMGLTPSEHVVWSEAIEHPREETHTRHSKELWAALDFEIENEATEIDRFRHSELRRLIKTAKEMKKSQSDWARQADERNRSVVQKLHGPFLRECLRQATGSHSSFRTLLNNVLQGFPFVGDLPPCEGAARLGRPRSFPKHDLQESDLRKDRKEINEHVLAAMKPLPFEEDILPQTLADAELGFMSQPRRFEPQDVEDKNLTRRIPVREERAKGWRTRVVDHETESLINEATRPADRVKHDSVDVMAFIVVTMLAAGVMVNMWKRDISSAFRRIPIRADHLDLAWVAWMANNELWISQHLGMPFGTVSAVYAWHRMGHALLFLVMALLKAPMGRYVDDFFGASRAGITCTGGYCLSVVAALVGLPTDDSKDADKTISMALLGAQVIVRQPSAALLVKVDQDKAEK